MIDFQSMPATLQISVGGVNSYLWQDSVSLPDMTTVGERVKAEREAKGISRAELAKRIGAKGESYISELELGGIKKGGRLHRIAEELGLNVHWLETGKGPQYPFAPDSGEDGWDDLLAYSQAAGLSDGEEAQEYAETHKLKFRSESLSRKRLNPRNLAVMYGKGDSMEPRIHSGDAVLFDQADTRPVDGGIFVILVPGAGAESYSVKRCELIDDMVFFKADNPKGDHGWRKPKRMDDKRHPIKIIGRVRWIGSWEE